jgi:hypothetical protein
MQGTEDTLEHDAPQYRPAHRTARKAAKAAKQELLQEQEQLRLDLEDADMQSRLDLLEAANLELQFKLAKAKRNKKKALKRLRCRPKSGAGSSSSAGEQEEPQVVHAAADCEEEDADVVFKDSFLSGSGKGVSDCIDEELAVHAAAQAALLGDNALEALPPVKNPSLIPLAFFLPPLPLIPKTLQNAPTTPTRNLFDDYDAPTRGTSRMECYGGRGSAAKEEQDKQGEKEAEEEDFLDQRCREEEAAIAENAAQHDERVLRLVNSGYLLQESMKAVKETKQEGLESTQRAVEWLRVHSSTPIEQVSKALANCQNQINQQKTDLCENKALAQEYGPNLSEFVSLNPGSEGAARKVKGKHDANSFGHLSSVGKAALILKQAMARERDLETCKWLGAICMAVCEDCSKCAVNRNKRLEKEELDLAKVLSNDKPGRIRTPWEIEDSKRDYKLPRLSCYVCDAMPEAERRKPPPGEEEWVNHCSNCKRAAHAECDKLVGWVEDDGTDAYYCDRCALARQRRHEREEDDRNRRRQSYPNAFRIQGGAAAVSHRHIDRPAARPQATPPSGLGSSVDSADTPQQLLNSPSKSSGWDRRQELANMLQELGYKNTNSDLGTPKGNVTETIPSTNFGSTATTGSSNTNVKIQNYIMWEESGAGKPKHGTETGSGATAWAWFKRTNIPIRDAAVNMKGGLGLLAANAISHNMQVTLAAGMLNEAEVQPKTDMSEGEIDIWAKGDREFTWFKKLSDEILIKVMDRLSSSVNPAPFFRMAISAEIPAFKDGDLYYPVTEFTNHADKWVSTLSELIKGGWKEGSTNLKQVFLASISSCQLVYDQARREMHEDVLRLIATLKKWIIVQDNEIQSAKAAKASIKNRTRITETQQPQDTDKSFEKRVRALFTAMQGGQAPISSGQTTGQDKTHLGPMWQCQHCGNEWRDDPIKPPRCKKECVYHEHKDFNKTEKYPKGAKPLSWKAYGEPYPPKQQAFFDKRDTQKGVYPMNLKPEGRRK